MCTNIIKHDSMKLHYQAHYSALFVDGAEALDEVLVDFIGSDDFARR